MILLSLALSFMAMGLLCLFAGDKAFYWCIWAILAPVVILAPHMMGLAFFPNMTITMLIVFVIMFFVANAVLKDTVVATTRKATHRLIVAWILPFAVYGILVCIHKMPISIPLPNLVYSTFFTMLLNLVCYVLTALLETYTVCYIKCLRKR